MSDTGTTVLNLYDEQVTFIQHHLPGLEAGSYTLTLTQHRKNDSGSIGDTFTNTYPFAVKGDRFRLSNPAEVYAVFPAANSAGAFDTVLPHVVFQPKTFPWIRCPNSKAIPLPSQPGKDSDQDVPTWLTVLLLDEDDVTAAPGLSLEPVQRTINDLFPAQLGANGVSYFNSDTEPLDFGEQRSDAILTIDIPMALFWKLAPTLADLGYLAHARQVSLLPKVTMAGISDQGMPLGDFSIVFGNRLPQSGKRSYACLVSLEGLEDYLPDEEGNPQPPVQQDAGKFLRLAVLKNWLFDSFGSPATFDTAVLGLNGRDPKSESPAVLTTLQMPYQDKKPPLQGPLQMGYVPLNHLLRTGEKTVSWYRGPLAPYQITRQRVAIPISSPDQATGFDPTTGMFDVSYAMAWTLGRQLALQDAGFSIPLYQWKKEKSREVVDQIENELLQEKFGPLLAGQNADTLELENAPLRSALRRKMLNFLLK